MKGEHPIRRLCELLNVSSSGYYRWLQQRPSTRQRQDTALAAQVAAAHRASRGTYGAPRILVDLQENGTRTSKRRCARLMREQGLQGRKKHRRKPRTTDSRHAKPVAENMRVLCDRVVGLTTMILPVRFIHCELAFRRIKTAQTICGRNP